MKIIIISSLTLFLINNAFAASQNIYRYKDNKGNIIYSDSYPANEKNKYDILSPKSGVLKKSVEKQLDENEQELANQQAAQIIENAKQKEVQRKYDTSLLSTYATIEEIDRVRNYELNQIQTSIKNSIDNIANIKDKQAQIETQGSQEDKEKLRNDLESANKFLEEQKQLLVSRNTKYNNDKKRYAEILKELTANTPPPN